MSRTRLMLGFKSFGEAHKLIAGIETMHMITKWQLRCPKGLAFTAADPTSSASRWSKRRRRLPSLIPRTEATTPTFSAERSNHHRGPDATSRYVSRRYPDEVPIP